MEMYEYTARQWTKYYRGLPPNLWAHFPEYCFQILASCQRYDFRLAATPLVEFRLITNPDPQLRAVMTSSSSCIRSLGAAIFQWRPHYKLDKVRAALACHVT